MMKSHYKFTWISPDEWRRVKKRNTDSVIDGVKYMLAYNDEIGTHLKPVKIIGVDNK